jgi:hypothetical protein
MVRATFTAIVAAAILAGGVVAYSAESDSQAAKELAPLQVAECCFVKQIKELADAKRENANLARQLAAERAAKNPNLSGQRADTERAQASKGSDNNDNADVIRLSDQKVLIME